MTIEQQALALVKALTASTECMEAVLVAVDEYNNANGTAIVGLGLRQLAIQIAANEATLAKHGLAIRKEA